MIMLENKLDIFKKLIFDSKKVISQQELVNEQEKIQRVLEDKKKEIQKSRDILLNKKREYARSKRDETILEQVQINRQELLEVREQFLEMMMDDIKIKTMEFTKGEEYRQKLLADLENAIGDFPYDNMVIMVVARDLDIVKNLVAGLKDGKEISVETMDDRMIGGFMIQDGKRLTNIDYSYGSKIQDGKYRVGKELYRFLQEAGENIG